MGQGNTLLSSAIATPIIGVVETVVICVRALIEYGVASSDVPSFSNTFSFG
jgi:hypothetical protein